MAKLGRTFDAQDHDTEQQEYQKLPLGIYDLEMVASEVDEKDTGDIVLKGTLEVLAPEDFAGRKVFLNFNLQHSSAKAQEIGQQEFARLCRAIGETTVDDSEELHFKRFRAKIGIGKDPRKRTRTARRNGQAAKRSRNTSSPTPMKCRKSKFSPQLLSRAASPQSDPHARQKRVRRLVKMIGRSSASSRPRKSVPGESNSPQKKQNWERYSALPIFRSRRGHSCW